MTYYIIHNNKDIYTAENQEALSRYYSEPIQVLPDDYNSEKYIVVDGQLILNPEYNDLMLERAKESKISENDTKRDSALNGGVVYKEILFDSDTDQKVNLLATVGEMSDEDTITWYGMDNAPLECTKLDLINIGGLITALHTFCWNKNAYLKTLIHNAETIEEVEAIVIDYITQEV